MELNIINQTTYLIDDNRLQILQKIAQKTEATLGLKTNLIVSVILMSATEVHEINLQYRNIDKTTDVISFALKDEADHYDNDEVEEELGDIFISVDAIQKQANEYGHSEERELGFLFGHGLLHLLGYDHQNSEDEREMFSLQEEIIDEVIKRH